MREVIRPTGRVVAGASTLAVIIPGFLDSGSWPGAASLAARLHRSGRTALSFDPRGTWSAPAGAPTSPRANRSRTSSR
jgi:hypothetical protein